MSHHIKSPYSTVQSDDDQLQQGTTGYGRIDTTTHFG